MPNWVSIHPFFFVAVVVVVGVKDREIERVMIFPLLLFLFFFFFCFVAQESGRVLTGGVRWRSTDCGLCEDPAGPKWKWGHWVHGFGRGSRKEVCSNSSDNNVSSGGLQGHARVGRWWIEKAA